VSRKQIQQTLIGVVLLGVLYWYLSPQQNCIRDRSAGLSLVEGKAAAEAVQAEKQQIIDECGESNAW
jgi:cbb3-type cytochrome oxidase subunit 3